jgi:chromate transport protein ChrA
MWLVAHGEAAELSDVNAVFYEDFFGLLVLVDVLVLVVSLGFTHDHDQVFRNAGYVASTVLVRLSFQTDRFQSLLVLLFALAFALAVQRVTRTGGEHGRATSA